MKGVSTQHLIWVGLGFLLGALPTGAYLLTSNIWPDKNCRTNFVLTSPLLGCSEYEESLERMHALDSLLKNAVNVHIKSGGAIKISVWVRDLETKQWAAVNEHDTFVPASLLKTPIMIAYFKLAEIKSEILEVKLVYKKSKTFNSDNQIFKPGNSLLPGEIYSVEELIEHMIINSDNDAAAMLVEKLDRTFYEDTLTELGIHIPIDETSDINYITAKSYANIFRILYNASYLQRNLSEKALSLMSASKFRGMAESVPESTIVSHKFGELTLYDENDLFYLRQLHDCGIVYKKDRPYSLCIMTQGNNFDDLLSIIKDLSAIAYEAM